jgi:hypothetical protein
MKNKRLFILIGAIVLVIAAFWLLDFRLAFSSTGTEKLVMTTDMGEKNMPVAMQRKERLSLVMAGEGPLVEALQKALVKELEQAGLGEVVLEQELAPGYPNPVLVVKVIRPGPLWTPVFAMGGFSVHAGYDSGGDTTFMQPVEDTHTSVAKPDAANMYFEYDVRDRTLGLISRPGYHRYLAEFLAREIITVLKGMYKV